MIYYKYRPNVALYAALPPGACATGLFYFERKNMARISFFIDGFNFYHALDNDHLRNFKWINLRKLAESYLLKQDSISDIFYFTAFATWNPDKVKRHKLFIRAQESFGVKTVLGEFRSTTKRCRNCGKSYETFEEKETDVNIAIALLEQARLNRYDNAIILSKDSDQVPAIRAVQKNYPAKKIGVLIPPGGRAKLLSQEADFYSKIGLKQLTTSRMPDQMTLADGSQIYCPQEWKQSCAVAFS